ncbi:MAG: hypothetical protein IPK59_01395 [Rhodospirillaceae bacterium]|nr:hypothetical protein [Rhodospirillaceae bacterium]
MRIAHLSLLLLLGTGACTSTDLLAKPDITARLDQTPEVMANCLTTALANEFRGTMPDLLFFGPKAEISVYAPRGGLIAFMTVEPHPNNKSMVKFYNGDLYWPTHQVSGMFPDMARDNWHRADAAIRACAPVAAQVPSDAFAAPAS